MNKLLARTARKVNPTLECVGRIWPSTRFGIGWRYGGDREETPHEKLFFSGRIVHIDEHENQVYRPQAEGGSAAPLGLSNAPNCHSSDDGLPPPPQARGLNGITSHGRNMVESAARLLQWKYGKDKLSFGTVTYPNVSTDEGWMLAGNWRDIVRVFFQRLKRLMSRRGQPWHYVAVTEVQTKRLGRENHPALHLHFVFLGGTGRYWFLSPRDIRREWAETLKPYLGDDRFWDAVENLEPIRKDAGAYLGKYMSKGTGVLQDLQSIRPLAELPHSWYSISRPLSSLVKVMTVSHGDVLQWVQAVASGYSSSGFFTSVFEVNLDWGNGWGLKGWAGSLTRRILRSIWKSTGREEYLKRWGNCVC